MHYEEKIIDGILHWRSTPTGAWIAKTPEQLTSRIAELEAAQAQAVPDVDWLSNVIRTVDGENKLGAGALAEKIIAALTAATTVQAVPDVIKRAYDALKVHVDECGGCDHSVGICYCSDYAILDDLKAALTAATTPAGSQQDNWPKLDKPAQVGGVVFHAGVSSRLVVEAAQRRYEYESTPEREAARIEKGSDFINSLQPPAANAAQDVRNQALEEVAQICRDVTYDWDKDGQVLKGHAGAYIEHKICALKTPAKREGE